MERKQNAHHKENTTKLESIERSSGSTAVRMNLLFNEEGKGLFYELQQEVKKLSNRVVYATGVIAGSYIAINLLKSFHIL